MRLPIIRGELVFQGSPADIGGAAVHVLVEDVSRADGPAQTVGAWSVAGLAQGTTSSKAIPFDVQLNALDTRGRYSLRAHVDVDRDGQTSIGDFITMEEYPVGGTGADFYRLQVHRVE